MNLWSAPNWRIGGVHQTACYFGFGDLLHLEFGMFSPQFRGDHRTPLDPWGLGLPSQTLGLWVLYDTTSRGRTIPTIGSLLLVGVVPCQKAESSLGTRPSHQCGRQSCLSWCRGACKAPFWGTSSGAGASWEEKMGDEVLHHQLIIFIRLRPYISSLLFEHLQGFSYDQVPRHPKLLGSRG